MGMRSDGPIHEYLKALQRALGPSEQETDQILTEVADHLSEARDRLISDGVEPLPAERRAVERFGDAYVVADRFLLERVVRRGSHRLRRTVVVNAVVAVALWMYWAGWVIRSPHPVIIAAAVFSSVFGLVVVAAYAWIVFQARTTSGLEQDLHEQVRARLRIARTGRFQVAAISVFVAVHMPWKLIADWDMYAAEPWRGVVGFGGVVVITLFLARAFHLERREAEAKLQRLTARPRHPSDAPSIRSPAERPQSPVVERRVDVAQTVDARAVAEDVLASLEQQDFARVFDRFTEDMRVAVPLPEIGRVWMSRVEQSGLLTHRGEPLQVPTGVIQSLLGGGRKTIVDFPVKFGSDDCHVQIVVDAEGRVPGMVLLPGAPTGRFGR